MRGLYMEAGGTDRDGLNTLCPELDLSQQLNCYSQDTIKLLNSGRKCS